MAWSGRSFWRSHCSTTLPSHPQMPSFPLHSPPPPRSISSFPTNALPSPPRQRLKPAAARVYTGRWSRKWAASPSPGPVPFSGLLEQCISLAATTTIAMASSLSSSPSAAASAPSVITPAATVVRDFYNGVNRRDLESVAPLISDACVYEDLIFSRPFVGRQAILDFFKKFMESISSDLQFVIDDLSSEDSSAVGVTWHLEWRGRPFPFSKGCSFYRLEVLDGKRQIVYGRDCVEPATKPGDMALVLVRVVTSVLQLFPQLADRF